MLCCAPVDRGEAWITLLGDARGFEEGFLTCDTQVRFERALESDIPAMTGVMTRAFDDDSRRFRGLPEGGPPGYNTGEFLEKWMKPGLCYKMLRSDEIIGVFIVFTNVPQPGHNVLGTIFIDPAYQDRGIGTQAMSFIHETFPAERWLLETPKWATRDHHFYRKNGYEKSSERFDSEAGFTVFVFERVS